MTDTNGHASRDKLLGATGRRYRENVIVPGYEELGKFRIRSLNERERSEYEGDILSTKGQFNKKRLEQQKRRLLVLTLVDDQGNQLLSNSDLRQLEEIDSHVTGYLFDAACDHCGLNKDDFDDLVKNSDRISVD